VPRPGSIGADGLGRNGVSRGPSRSPVPVQKGPAAWFASARARRLPLNLPPRATEFPHTTQCLADKASLANRPFRQPDKLDHPGPDRRGPGPRRCANRPSGASASMWACPTLKQARPAARCAVLPKRAHRPGRREPCTNLVGIG
jgi:hypothetical protein